ncbi:cytochrome P460 family protein [Roseibacillus ishigakijimensis]|uniref:Cytochrome P460 family protein n=1 Tax=Roseibacillus ishigakijimensis TaxID=454146 RepID=A0A934RSS6_9BACT|nr:cytochrome P460 family protein [Roseibacillus ishigakijimensis]MBK1834986.1 cytochrome P460 family protein [Roseibacillus ishigakijimensis]
MKKKLLAIAALVPLISLGISYGDDAKEEATENETGSRNFFTIDGEGNLERPKAFREWVFMGTPLTPNDMNNGKATFPEFHNVYIDPVSFKEYKETGKFRDGTIIVKEMVSVGSKAAASGAGYFMGEFVGLEATIKSSEHFPDEPGNWAYFSFTDLVAKELKELAKPFPAAACNACHDAVAQDDFVFTQYYPVMRAAKGYGEGNPEETSERPF